MQTITRTFGAWVCAAALMMASAMPAFAQAKELLKL